MTEAYLEASQMIEFFTKIFNSFGPFYFRNNVPSLIFDWVLNKPLFRDNLFEIYGKTLTSGTKIHDSHKSSIRSYFNGTF